MFRASASPRLVLGLVLVAGVGTGVGLGVAAASPGTTTPPALHALTAVASTAAVPATTATPAPPAPAPLTVDQAKAVALQASPGIVVDVQTKDEAADPAEATDATEPTDPNEATDPTEATDPAEPTGLSYDVTVQHQNGTTTEVVVDAATGHVVSTKVDDNPNGD